MNYFTEHKKVILLYLLVFIIIVSAGCAAFFIHKEKSKTVSLGNQSEIINGIPVPPEPNKKVNNSTIAGIDVNNNGVRDDVERLVARKAKSPAEGAIILAGAVAYQKILSLPQDQKPTRD